MRKYLDPERYSNRANSCSLPANKLKQGEAFKIRLKHGADKRVMVEYKFNEEKENVGNHFSPCISNSAVKIDFKGFFGVTA